MAGACSRPAFAKAEYATADISAQATGEYTLNTAPVIPMFHARRASLLATEIICLSYRHRSMAAAYLIDLPYLAQSDTTSELTLFTDHSSISSPTTLRETPSSTLATSFPRDPTPTTSCRIWPNTTSLVYEETTTRRSSSGEGGSTG